MYKAFVGQKPAIPLHEECRGEALMHVLHLRVGERQPYLLNLVGSEETVNDFYACAEESYILKILLQGLLCSCVHPRAFDVDANEVYICVQTCQTYSIFSLSTSQLKNDWVIVVEILFTPVSLCISKGTELITE